MSILRFDRIIYALLLLLIPLTAQNNLVSLNTEEFTDFRRVLLLIPFDINGRQSFPVLKQDGEKGRFTLSFDLPGSAAYLGPETFRETGRQPVRIRVENREDRHFTFTFETLPFEKVIAWYVPESGQFIYDIYRSMPLESFMLEESVGLRSLSEPPLRHESSADMHSSGSAGRSSVFAFLNLLEPRHREMAMKAVLFSLLILLVILILFSFLLIYTRSLLKKQKAGTARSRTVRRPAAQPAVQMTTPAGLPVAPAPREPASDFDVPELRTPEDRDRAIRTLMARRNISYDEAAMILMMKPGNLNVKV